MARFFRRIQVEPAKIVVETKDDRASNKSDGVKLESSNSNVTVDQEQLKVDNPPQEDTPEDKEQLKEGNSPPEDPSEDQEQLKADNSPQEDPPELQMQNIGDYVGLQSRPYIRKILEKQGDRNVLFVDKVFKFTCSGKMKKRLFLITDFALYIVDPETDSLRRRIALAAVDRLCMSKLPDHFFAVIIPTEYDLLMSSTRKTEIVTLLVDATRSSSNYDLEVSQSNRFEYNAAAEVMKEVQCEEVEGGVRTRIVKK